MSAYLSVVLHVCFHVVLALPIQCISLASLPYLISSLGAGSDQTSLSSNLVSCCYCCRRLPVLRLLSLEKIWMGVDCCSHTHAARETLSPCHALLLLKFCVNKTVSFLTLALFIFVGTFVSPRDILPLGLLFICC